ncbi:MAG: hypothetical protein RBQ91_00030 [Acholeplasma sp.]|nr:hypothetical protein [Acholeplasma sp.]
MLIASFIFAVVTFGLMIMVNLVANALPLSKQSFVMAVSLKMS